VQLIFDRVVTKKTPGEFRTRVIQDGVYPSLHIQYKNFDLKQYFKEGRGCRTEGTFRNTKDFDVNKGLANLPYLQKIGRLINRRRAFSGPPWRSSRPTTPFRRFRFIGPWIASTRNSTCRRESTTASQSSCPPKMVQSQRLSGEAGTVVSVCK
jgi:hypothetical protein